MHVGFMWSMEIPNPFQRPLTVPLQSPNSRQIACLQGCALRLWDSLVSAGKARFMAMVARQSGPPAVYGWERASWLGDEWSRGVVKGRGLLPGPDWGFYVHGTPTTWRDIFVYFAMLGTAYTWMDMKIIHSIHLLLWTMEYIFSTFIGLNICPSELVLYTQRIKA